MRALRGLEQQSSMPRLRPMDRAELWWMKRSTTVLTEIHNLMVYIPQMSILPFLSRPFLFLTGPGARIQEREKWSVRNKDQERVLARNAKTFLHDLRSESLSVRGWSVLSVSILSNPDLKTM